MKKLSKILQNIVLGVLISFNLLNGAITSVQPAGSGTQEDPYQIANINNLYWLSMQHNGTYTLAYGTYFVQTADINASETIDLDSGQGWTPIGGVLASEPFGGYYDGKNYKITNLYINRNSTYVGLFGYAFNNQGQNSIANVILEDVNITTNSTSESYIGVLVGRIALGNISNVKINNGTLTPSGSSTAYIGSLAGYIDRTDVNSSSSDIVINSSNSATSTYIGGLVGSLNNTYYINNSSSATNITKSGNNYAGGFVGQIFGTGTISNSFSSGSLNTSSGYKIGGFAGSINAISTIENCYTISDINVTNSIYTGGFFAYLTANASFNRTYTASKFLNVIGNGGFGGYSSITDINITSSFWDTNTTGQLVGVYQKTTAGLIGKTTSELKDLNNSSDASSWDFTNIWTVNPLVNDGYPAFKWQALAPLVFSTIDPITLDEDFTEYNITLGASADSSENLVYTLVNDNSSIATATLDGDTIVLHSLANISGTIHLEVNASTSTDLISQTITITINPINDTPTFTTNLVNQTINEDNGTLSFELNVSDVEGSDLNVTIDSNDSTILSVSKAWSGPITTSNYNNLDFNLTTEPNANGIVQITLKVDDGDKNTTTTYDINISSVPDIPTDITLTNNTINENLPANILIGALSSTDVDSANFTYTLVSGDGDTDNALFTIVGNELNTTTSFDFETKPIYFIRVRTTDDQNQIFEKAFTININDVDDAPVISPINNITINEDSNDFNITIVVSDDENDSITLSATSSDESIATVSFEGNILKIDILENAHGTTTIEVNATANGKTTLSSFTLELTAQNDTPTLLDIANVSKDEDFTTFNVSIHPSDVDHDNLRLTVDMNDSSIISIPANSTDWILEATYSSGLSLPISAIENQYGSVELNVSVEDPSGAKISKQFIVIVNSIDDAPIATSMAATVGPNSVNTFDQFTPSYTDAEGDVANTLKIETLPSVGSFESDIDGDGNWTTITIVPFEVNMTELAKYRFNAGDNAGANVDVNWSIRTTVLWSNTATGVVTIIDSNLNNAPDVNISLDGNDINGTIVSIDEDNKTNTIYVTFSDDYTQSKFLVGIVDANDSTKIAMDDFNITRISDNNLSVIVTPKANVYGDVTITLGAFDGDKNGTKSFTLRINSINDIPTAYNFETTIDEDNNYSFSNLDVSSIYRDTNDSTQDSNETNPNLLKIVTLPQHGILHIGDLNPLSAETNISINDLANLVYTPEENNNSDVNFTWQAYDGEVWTDIKTATIHINPIDDAPVIEIIPTVVLNEDMQTTIEINASDVEGHTITFNATSLNPDIATVTVYGNQITVWPVTNANGIITVEINATSNGQTVTDTFDINITAINDNPIITYPSNNLIPSDGDSASILADSVAISGDFAVVGHKLKGGSSLNEQGAVYVYKKVDGVWSEFQKLLSSDISSQDNFGNAVAIDGTTIVVGANKEDEDAYGDNTLDGAGSVYLFTYNSSSNIWEQSQKLVASDRASGAYFGTSVAIDGTKIVVGTPNPNNATGKAYIFSKSGTWSETKILSGSTGFSEFGNSVAIKNDIVAIGAVGTNKVYLYDRDGLNPQIITSDDATFGDQFGGSIALGDDFIAVGAPYESAQGAVYIFDNNGTQTGKIVADDNASGDNFGYDISTDGYTLVVSAHQKNDTNHYGSNEGKVYTYINNGASWVEATPIISSNVTDYDKFGSSVAVDGNSIFVGTLKTNAYVYTMPTATENNISISSLHIQDVDGDSLSYSITGTDSALFDINDTTGVLSFKVAPDYEHPEDNDSNNIYEVNVSVDDGNVTVSKMMSIFAQNVLEAPVLSLPDSNTTGEDPGAFVWIDLSPYVTTEAGSSVSFTAVSSNESIAIVFINDTFLGVSPVANANGIITVEINATSNGQTVTDTFDINITAINDEPVVSYANNNLIPSDADTDSILADAVAIDGEWAVVGHKLKGGSSLNEQGAVYVYKKVDGVWSEFQKLLSSDISSQDNFGNAVAIDGTTIVVGANKEDEDAYGENTLDGAGSVYLFTYNSSTNQWVQSQKLVASDRSASAYFGTSVAIDGTKIVVSTPNPNNATGKAYIFSKSGTWSETTILSGSAGFSEFGNSVAIKNDIVAISENGYGKENVYLYDTLGNSIQTLTPTISEDTDKFGSSIAIGEDFIAIGCSNDDGNGSVYIYTNNGTWTNTQIIKPSDSASGDGFGYRVATDGYTLVVSSNTKNDTNHIGNYEGKVYSFINNGTSWVQAANIIDSNSTDYNKFGSAVSVDGNSIFVGTLKTNAYVYTMPTATENNISISSLHIQDVDGDDLNYSISGYDSSLFDINDTTGVLSFKVAPDYENPEDNDSNNIYELNVSVNDGNMTISKLVSVFVQNVLEAPTLTLPDSNTTEEDTRVTIDLSSYITSEGSVTLTASSSNSDIASVSVYDKTITIWPVANANGVITVEVNATSNGYTVTDTFDINITAVNDNPVMTYFQTDLNLSDGTSSEPVNAVAVSGEWAVVGASKKDKINTGDDMGAVYVYRKVDGVWSEFQKLIPDDNNYPLQNFDNFGSAVAIDGNTIAIGASLRGSNNDGAIYIYTFNGTTWLQHQYFQQSNAGQFGSVIALQNNTIAVSSPTYNSQKGAVHIYTRDTTNWWREIQRIDSPDSVSLGFFGAGIGLDGDRLAIGGDNLAKVYIYNVGADLKYTLSDTLQISDGGLINHFGAAVSVHGDDIIVGSYGNDISYNAQTLSDAGAVYIFTYNYNQGIWQQKQKLISSNPKANDRFGNSVATDGHTIVVGAPFEDEDSISIAGGKGMAYTFINDGTSWVEAMPLINPDRTQFAGYGWGVAVDGSEIIVGAQKTNALLYSLPIATENNISISALGVSDVDGDSLAYSISGYDSSLFDINDTTGNITFKVAPDYENPSDSDGNNIYELNVSVDDGNITISKLISIFVKNVLEAPTITLFDTNATLEDTQFVLDLTSYITGEDDLNLSVTSSNNTIAYPSIIGNILTIYPQPNKNGTVTITIEAKNATDGTYFSTHSFDFNVTSVDDAPQFLATTITPIRKSFEDANNTTLYKTILAGDVDNDYTQIVYSVVSVKKDGNLTSVIDANFTNPNEGNLTITINPLDSNDSGAYLISLNALSNGLDVNSSFYLTIKDEVVTIDESLTQSSVLNGDGTQETTITGGNISVNTTIKQITNSDGSVDYSVQTDTNTSVNLEIDTAGVDSSVDSNGTTTASATDGNVQRTVKVAQDGNTTSEVKNENNVTTKINVILPNATIKPTIADDGSLGMEATIGDKNITIKTDNSGTVTPTKITSTPTPKQLPAGTDVKIYNDGTNNKVQYNITLDGNTNKIELN